MPEPEETTVIRYKCPACQVVLQAAETDSGKAAACPKCGQKLKIPAASEPQPKVRLEVTEQDVVEVVHEVPREAPRRRDPDDRPRKSQRDDRYDYRDRGRGRIVCPYCESELPPIVRKRISLGGWVLSSSAVVTGLGSCLGGLLCLPLIIVSIICVPLAAMGILVTTDDKVCSECNARLG